jgi:phosphoglycerol transferase MdoB-like AlkP superfamily enzyme
MQILKNRYLTYLAFLTYFILCSFIVRTVLLASSFSEITFPFLQVFRIYFLGIFYDFGTGILLLSLYNIYLFLIPSKYLNTRFSKILTISIFFILTLITLFSFFAELTFWQEFKSRFNFIAVDYLIYTFEVINNINESYPLPILISVMLIIAIGVTYFFYRKHIFSNSLISKTPLKFRLIVFTGLSVISLLFLFFVKNNWAESSTNRYANELSKAGIYSFFAAFKNNELNYRDFYKLIDTKEAYNLVRAELKDEHTIFDSNSESIKRFITSSNPTQKPNVITITVESLSADFLEYYGNKDHLTPTLDSLTKHSIFFSNMYATGTRTVRGMEALTLAIPPTPGSSIVRRDNNNHLLTVGHVFKEAGYINTFFYGGDGYFDNMNNYFGNNNYNIVDRGRKLLDEKFDGTRSLIPDSAVNFENAWGICDGDIFEEVIKDADIKYKKNLLFNNFVMTTSNHRPFTFPAGKINLPIGTREAAVRYTDFAIGDFLNKIKNKPWYKNTVIVIVADHCASSAGKNEIDISKYKIPCLILNLKNSEELNINKMTSQIDLYPTLWALLGWNYTSNFYGKNVLDSNYKSRIVLGTYQKLVYMKADSMVILSPQRKIDTYLYNASKNEQTATKFPKEIINQSIANYQSAYDLFKTGKLKY